MNFNDVHKWEIPEGFVTKVTDSNGDVIWEFVPYDPTWDLGSAVSFSSSSSTASFIVEDEDEVGYSFSNDDILNVTETSTDNYELSITGTYYGRETGSFPISLVSPDSSKTYGSATVSLPGSILWSSISNQTVPANVSSITITGWTNASNLGIGISSSDWNFFFIEERTPGDISLYEDENGSVVDNGNLFSYSTTSGYYWISGPNNTCTGDYDRYWFSVTIPINKNTTTSETTHTIRIGEPSNYQEITITQEAPEISWNLPTSISVEWDGQCSFTDRIEVTASSDKNWEIKTNIGHFDGGQIEIITSYAGSGSDSGDYLVGFDVNNSSRILKGTIWLIDSDTNTTLLTCSVEQAAGCVTWNLPKTYNVSSDLQTISCIISDAAGLGWSINKPNTSAIRFTNTSGTGSTSFDIMIASNLGTSSRSNTISLVSANGITIADCEIIQAGSQSSGGGSGSETHNYEARVGLNADNQEMSTSVTRSVSYMSQTISMYSALTDNGGSVINAAPTVTSDSNWATVSVSGGDSAYHELSISIGECLPDAVGDVGRTAVITVTYNNQYTATITLIQDTLN